MNNDFEFDFLDGIEEFLHRKDKTVGKATVSPAITVPTPQPVGVVKFSIAGRDDGSFQNLKPTEGEPAQQRDVAPQILQPLQPEIAPLHNRNAKQPAYTRKEEKPVHRAMLELAAQGLTNEEIAKRLGKTTQCVQDILRQPGTGEFLAKRVTDNFGTDQQVVETIKGAVVKAVETVAGILKDEKAKNSDRLAAAQMLLDRRYGKATQPISGGTHVDLNNLPDEELAKMVKQN